MKKSKEKDAEKVRRRWVISITLLAFFISVFMSLFSDIVLKKSNIVVAFIILVIIILIGILFDIIGVAVTVADERPFHSMASSKVKGARSSLVLIKNASKVSSVCNDVVGDICGIISGSSAAFIVTQVGDIGFIDTALFSVILSGIVASMTIGGKAIGKEFAIQNSRHIIKLMGRIVSIFIERKN